MPLSRLFAGLILTIPVFAQPFGRNAAAASLTHIHLNSADPAAATAFWTDVIGTSTTSRESGNGVSMLGALLLISAKAPSGPSAGSSIDHIAMRVPDVQPFADKVKKTPYKSFKPAGTQDVLMIDGPDGVRIELVEDNAMYAPLEFNHIHFSSAQPAEIQAWYGRFFGARPGTDDQAQISRLAGGALSFAKAASVVPTAGRAIDHISFEVRDLPAFCKTLTDGGLKLDALFDSKPVEKGATVYLSDPSGTRIELTESAAGR